MCEWIGRIGRMKIRRGKVEIVNVNYARFIEQWDGDVNKKTR